MSPMEFLKSCPLGQRKRLFRPGLTTLLLAGCRQQLSPRPHLHNRRDFVCCFVSPNTSKTITTRPPAGDYQPSLIGVGDRRESPGSRPPQPISGQLHRPSNGRAQFSLAPPKGGTRGGAPAALASLVTGTTLSTTNTPTPANCAPRKGPSH
ncbi:unnamed protein product [Bursaphelenchus okinawaensis]|uniref:Uncharacterized protein n=1 Tax=Bursaphelenchus okinawaensis TaxID=465554 RepID=A0A811JTB8_9BILA|nr:unnamed protein product [Bursaphelenchus okinawaensis]CAG9082339.1 unnamed protein product [Bursaphelenchus okinawaensis]